MFLSGSSALATRLSSVAMKEKDSDIIEVRLADKADQLQVFMNQQALSFSEQKWIDLKGKLILWKLALAAILAKAQIRKINTFSSTQSAC